MQDVSVIGIGKTPVSEQWEASLREIAHSALRDALDNAGLQLEDVDALVVANALGANLNHQNHIAALIADYCGLAGVEAIHVEGADAAGGLAVRQGTALVAAGMAKTVVVLGVEKVTDLVGPERTTALTSVLDADYESSHGATPAAMAGLLMRRYMYEYDVALEQFENFSINAHANGAKNKGAMYRNLIKPGRFASAPIVAPPLNLFDGAPEGDGACALVLTSTERAKDRVPKPIRITGSAVATDTLALHDRDDVLFLKAANLAAGRAYMQAGVHPQDMSVVELHDAYTVLTALQFEATGFAQRGLGWQVAADSRIGLTDDVPISTFGGLKARGNPLGATGVYQIAEVVQQLRADAGENQVPNATRGMALNLGGLGATAVAHILETV